MQLAKSEVNEQTFHFLALTDTTSVHVYSIAGAQIKSQKKGNYFYTLYKSNECF